MFLSLISNAKIKEAKNIYNWFLNTQVMDLGNAAIEALITRVLPIKIKDEKYLKSFERFLKAIDIGIDGIRIEEIKHTSSEEDETTYKVYSKHASIDASSYIEIPFSEESGGTQNVWAL